MDEINSDDASSLPFVASCRMLEPLAPLGWVRHGWQDMWAAPRQSLAYGALVILLSLTLAMVTIEFGGYWELLALVSGFILIAPILAVGTYVISSHLERGETPSLRRCIREEQRALGNLMVFALMLMVVFLVWARAGSAVHVFFPIGEAPDWGDYLTFFGIGSAIGSIFAAIVFSAAAFSLPMLVDRKVDTVTAVVTSINAVLRNKPAMVVWAACIVAGRGARFRAAVSRSRPLQPPRLADDLARFHVAADRACHVARISRHDRRQPVAAERRGDVRFRGPLGRQRRRAGVCWLTSVSCGAPCEKGACCCEEQAADDTPFRPLGASGQRHRSRRNQPGDQRVQTGVESCDRQFESRRQQPAAEQDFLRARLQHEAPHQHCDAQCGMQRTERSAVAVDVVATSGPDCSNDRERRCEADEVATIEPSRPAATHQANRRQRASLDEANPGQHDDADQRKREHEEGNQPLETDRIAVRVQ